ncbi:TIGR01458 family HAD-type hydrolase [Methanoregula sp.]|uniref:TIGR01458 family HAD-type hydrolase n=1 Tax=Methanoregula sp. TaxID=2052170 RepID=UPI000CBB1634|nr:TIGR01458 family HAD-type hydrolase [Methanoregula sp.]PKG31326.1 MAG: TIGR01458 family HAD-type hydrolase [Methanoregula sp.]
MDTKAFLIDLDGVLYVGDHAISGATETIAMLDEQGYPYRFVSNTTRKSRTTIAARLDRLGFSIPVSHIFTPAIAAISLIRNEGYTRCFLLTTGDVDNDFAEAEIKSADTDADGVIIGDAGDNFTYGNLTKAMRLILDGAGLIALERDRYWMGENGLMLSAGPFVAALEYATSTCARVVGKPSGNFFALALSDMGARPEETLMIGDDITTDIGGAREAGMRGVLVKTGKYRNEAVASSGIIPDYILDSIGHLREIL